MLSINTFWLFITCVLSCLQRKPVLWQSSSRQILWKTGSTLSLCGIWKRAVRSGTHQCMQWEFPLQVRSKVMFQWIAFHIVEFEVLTAVVMNVAIFWDIAPCSSYGYTLVLAWLIFDPEGGGDMVLQNISSHLDYTAPFPQRWQQYLHISVFFQLNLSSQAAEYCI
jgi:hypothetical protein